MIFTFDEGSWELDRLENFQGKKIQVEKFSLKLERTDRDCKALLKSFNKV